MPQTLKDRYRKVSPEKNLIMAEPKRDYYPSVHLPLAVIPEAKKWKVGETYEISLKVKQTGVSENEHGGNVSFDILGIKVH